MTTEDLFDNDERLTLMQLIVQAMVGTSSNQYDKLERMLARMVGPGTQLIARRTAKFKVTADATVLPPQPTEEPKEIPAFLRRKPGDTEHGP